MTVVLIIGLALVAAGVVSAVHVLLEERNRWR